VGVAELQVVVPVAAPAEHRVVNLVENLVEGQAEHLVEDQAEHLVEGQAELHGVDLVFLEMKELRLVLDHRLGVAAEHSVVAGYRRLQSAAAHLVWVVVVHWASVAAHWASAAAPTSPRLVSIYVRMLWRRFICISSRIAYVSILQV
jgi:hypothetical protein